MTHCGTLRASFTVKKQILIPRHVLPAGSSKSSQYLSTVVTFNYSFNGCHHQSVFQGHGGSCHPSSDWMDGPSHESRNETVSTCDRDHDNTATGLALFDSSHFSSYRTNLRLCLRHVGVLVLATYRLPKYSYEQSGNISGKSGHFGWSSQLRRTV